MQRTVAWREEAFLLSADGGAAKRATQDCMARFFSQFMFDMDGYDEKSNKFHLAKEFKPI
jgi:hypothetical protein